MNAFKQFLMFDFFITTWIVRIGYWLAQALVIILALVAMFFGGELSGAITEDYEPNFLVGLLILVAGSLLVRLFSEGVIVLFTICENTSHLKKD